VRHEFALQELRDRAHSAVSLLGRCAPRIAEAAASTLTFANRGAFVAFLRSTAVRRGYSGQYLEAFLSGLGAVVPAELLPLFTPGELEALLCGRSEVDVEALKRTTIYEFVQPTAPHVQWLWEVLAEESPATREAFVNFVTARSRLPPGVQLKIEMPTGQQRSQPDKFMPQSATCFSVLKLPPYTSKEVLRTRLLYAIHHAATMDADMRASNAEGYEGIRT
jgi:hypothetical protein